MPSDLQIESYDGILHEDPPERKRVAPDPKDDYLLALARVFGARLIISGDPHLTELKEVEVPVLTPRAFFDILRKIGP